MADTYTPNFNFDLPEIGASRDTWGTKLNGDLTALDLILAAAQPYGGMMDFAGANAPSGWLLCDGTLYSIATYPLLFGVIGARWGGDGVNNFAVPDCRARMAVGVGANYDGIGQYWSYGLGQLGGANGAYIGQGNLPNYQLPLSGDGGHYHYGQTTDENGDHSHSGGTDAQGAHLHNYATPQISAGWYIAGGAGTQINPGVTQQTDVQGSHVHSLTTNTAGGHTHSLTIQYSGQHSHQIYLGGNGAPLQVQVMYMVVTKIIYAGAPGYTAQKGLSVASSMRRLLRAPVRGHG